MILIGCIFAFIFAHESNIVYAQNSAADGLHSMLNQFAHNTGSDIQSLSYCRISTRDLIATAQSTANRVLQGVCNPRELSERFVTLETQIADQFNVLKTMILDIENQLRTQDLQNKKHHGKLTQAIRKMKSPTESTPSSGTGSSSTFLSNPSEYEAENNVDFGLPSEEISPRNYEINRYNSTMHQEDGSRVFTFYWRIPDINYKMENWGWRRSLRSESFYIFQGGYRMYMRIYPNQRGENVYVHVGLTNGDFDESLDWPFTLKHRIQIIDHGALTQDLISRVWDPTQLCSGYNWKRPDGRDNHECVGLGFEQTVLRTRNYIHDDSIVIKLTVYLA